MHEELMEQVVGEENLERALRAVKRKRGAAGIDKMTTEELEPHFRRHGTEIRAKLVSGRWTPSPVRRVEIPKPSGGKRQLGIPTVIDRLVQQALLQVLQPIFDPRFSESELRVPAGAECARCGTSGARIRSRGQGLGGGY